MENELRSEYDLKSLVRRLGSGRKRALAGQPSRLEPDVAQMFPNAKCDQ